MENETKKTEQEETPKGGFMQLVIIAISIYLIYTAVKLLF